MTEKLKQLIALTAEEIVPIIPAAVYKPNVAQELAIKLVDYALSDPLILEAAGLVKKEEWIDVRDVDPPQYSSIEVKNAEGKVFRGGYYQENSKVCIDLPDGSAMCMCLDEYFTHWRELPAPPSQLKK